MLDYYGNWNLMQIGKIVNHTHAQRTQIKKSKGNKFTYIFHILNLERKKS